MIEYFNELLGVDFIKTRNAVRSCHTKDQLKSAKNMIEIYRMKNPSLNHQYDLLLEHYRVKKEEFNPVKKTPEIQAI